MNTQVQTFASVQERVRERIQASFVDLIPQDLWDKMVNDELDRFTKHHLPEQVRLAATNKLQELLKKELEKQEWCERWQGSPNGPNPGSALAEALRQAAPDLVAAMFSNLGIQIVQALRNGQLRPY